MLLPEITKKLESLVTGFIQERDTLSKVVIARTEAIEHYCSVVKTVVDDLLRCIELARVELEKLYKEHETLIGQNRALADEIHAQKTRLESLEEAHSAHQKYRDETLQEYKRKEDRLSLTINRLADERKILLGQVTEKRAELHTLGKKVKENTKR